MKILVGLIYYAENEYEDCLKSINDQTYKKWDLFEVKNLPKKEAHHKLYSTFMTKATDYDLFLKIDADMVLARSTVFEEIIVEAKKYKQINHFEVKLLDYFTNSLIYGLHIYRNNVRWNLGNEVYFTDRAHSNTTYKVYALLTDPCVPIAIHAPNPSELQSFHFGVHKMVKVMQNAVAKPDLDSSTMHLKNIYLTQRNYLRTCDVKLVYAILGAFWALEERVGYREANYDSTLTRLALDKYENISNNELNGVIKAITRKYYMFMPLKSWIIYMTFKIHSLKYGFHWLLKKIIHAI